MTIETEAERVCRRIIQDRRRAEWYLLHTDAEQVKYYEDREKYIAGGNDERKLYNPTERIVVRGLDFDQFSGSFKWLKAVRIVETGMSGKEKLFLAARRKAAERGGRTIGRPGWVVYVQQKYYEIAKGKVSGSRWLSEDQIKRWWQKIVYRTADIAVRL